MAMHFRLAAACGVVLMTLATGALADPTPAATGDQPAVAPAKPAKDPNELICKHEQEVGSLLRKTTCHTRADWQAEAERSRQMMMDSQDAGQRSPQPLGH